MTSAMRIVLVVLAAGVAAIGCGDDTSDGGGGSGGGATGGAGAMGGGGASGGGGAGGASGGPFACVGEVVFPNAPAASLDISIRFFHLPQSLGDPADGAPAEGITVLACADGTDCSTPIDSATADATGAIALTLPTPGTGFAGYLRQSTADYVPVDMRFWPPIAAASSRWLQADFVPAAIPTAVFPEFVAAVAPTVILDDAKGTVIATTIDCDGAFTTAVTVKLDGADPDVDANGDHVFFNVTPGSIELVTTLTESGAEIARISGTVAAGEVSAFHYGPMPAP